MSELDFIDVYVFINRTYYGIIKWPFKKLRYSTPTKRDLTLRIRLTCSADGSVGFLRDCCPEWLSGYGSSSAAEGFMYVLSLGLAADYSEIKNLKADFENRNLNILWDKPKQARSKDGAK